MMGDVNAFEPSAIAGYVAAEADSKTGDIGPGLLAFLVVAALCVATFFLIRSMLVHIKRVPPTFEEPANEGEDQPPP
jgi:hypothetical protein